MKRTRSARVLSILAIVAIQCVIASEVRTQVRRYLPVTPGGGETWGNFFTNFDRDVVNAVKEIDAGEIRFDYNTRSGPNVPPANLPTYGGTALAGGFFMKPGVMVKPGFTLGWMQLITRETTIGIGQNPPYPDTPTNPTNPNYPFQTLPVAAVPAPTQAFQDFPQRLWSNGTQEWQAELALTCYTAPNAQGTREVRVAGSFFWGFAFNTTANPNRLVDRREPGLWGTGATMDFFNTFNARFRDFVGPPAPGQDRWNFVDSSNCFALVPEPATGMMMLVTMTLILRRRRAA